MAEEKDVMQGYLEHMAVKFWGFVPEVTPEELEELVTREIERDARRREKRRPHAR